MISTDNIVDIPSTGRFRILCLTSTDLLDRQSVSAQALDALDLLMGKFPASVIELIVLHPKLHRQFGWDDVPTWIKQRAEMRFHDGSALDDAYAIYGVDSAWGALAVIRPDGYVGVVARLDDVARVEEYLKRCIRMVLGS